MHDTVIATDLERRVRLRDLLAQDEERQHQIEQARKNRGFIQVYPPGFQRIKTLMGEWPLAAKLYLFLAEHIEDNTGAVVASQELLAKELGVTTRTIRRVTTWLDEKNIVPRIRLGAGTIYAYCLKPEEVWKSWDNAKDYAAFRTKTLARKKDNGDIKRRLKMLTISQQELPTSEDEK